MSQRRLFLLLLPIEGAALLLTRSASAIATAMILVLIVLALRGLGRISIGIWIVVLALAAAIALVALQLVGIDQILAPFGKDVTFSDRTAIWDLVLQFAAQRPVFGWGYKAFPLEQLLAATPADNGTAHFIVGSTHSSYLELYAELGAMSDPFRRCRRLAWPDDRV